MQTIYLRATLPESGCPLPPFGPSTLLFINKIHKSESLLPEPFYIPAKAVSFSISEAWYYIQG